MLFACVFTVISNAQYIFSGLKGKLKFAGGSVTHIGFGLLLLGALISQHNQKVISINKSGIDFGESFDEKNKMENILLRRDQPVQMGDYDVTYIGDSVAPPNNYYKVAYKKFDKQGNVKESFILYPNAQINPNMGLISNPDTRHYFTKDIYTHVTSVPDKEKMAEDVGVFELDTIAVGDTFYTAKSFVVIERMVANPDTKNFELSENDIAVGAQLKAQTLEGNVYNAMPVYVIKGNMPIMLTDSIAEIGATFRIEKILPEEQKVVLGIKEKDFENDFIILKAIMFPYINVLWLGCFIMVAGFILSMVRRMKENKLVAS
jgi:cytochrome c-type biogenesis protein CcmF